MAHIEQVHASHSTVSLRRRGRAATSVAWEDFHWHIEILPQMFRITGFEWASGSFYNQYRQNSVVFGRGPILNSVSSGVMITPARVGGLRGRNVAYRRVDE
jgi:hypothetical protein